MTPIKFCQLPSFTPCGSYCVNVDWSELEAYIAHQINPDKGTAKLNLDPDFQRAHVWTLRQQIAYVEYILMGGMSGRDIYLNCVGWMSSFRGPFELVDGKQRLTAVRAFLAGEINAFCRRYPKDFIDRIPSTAAFNIHINNLKTREEVLQWYLEMNTGGTPHSPKELEKVKQLLVFERMKNNPLP